jgi:hypothetical protein
MRARAAPTAGFPVHIVRLACMLCVPQTCAQAPQPNLLQEPTPQGLTCLTLRRRPGGRRPRPGGKHRRAGRDGVHLSRVRAQGAAGGIRSGSHWRLTACSESLDWPSGLLVTLLMLLRSRLCSRRALLAHMLG